MKSRDIFSRINRRIQLYVKLSELRIYSLFNKFHPENALVIFSDPRGGSTWLAELLNHIERSIIYWEPLSLVHNREIRKLNFGWRQHVPLDACWPEARAVFDQILSIKILNEWTTMRFGPREYLGAQLAIVKFCRANDLAPWLCAQYAFKYRPVVLLRHPFAVVASQLKQGGWDNAADSFQVPTMPFNHFYLEHVEFLTTLTTKAESLVATWCVTNRNLVDQSEKWNLIFYEELISDPIVQIEKLFADWNRVVPSSLLESVLTPSATNVDFVGGDISKQLGKWKHVFDEETLTKLQRVLDYFRVDIYSKDSPFPILKWGPIL